MAEQKYMHIHEEKEWIKSTERRIDKDAEKTVIHPGLMVPAAMYGCVPYRRV